MLRSTALYSTEKEVLPDADHHIAVVGLADRSSAGRSRHTEHPFVDQFLRSEVLK